VHLNWCFFLLSTYVYLISGRYIPNAVTYCTLSNIPPLRSGRKGILEIPECAGSLNYNKDQINYSISTYLQGSRKMAGIFETCFSIYGFWLPLWYLHNCQGNCPEICLVINQRWWKPTEQSRMDNLETLATLGTWRQTNNT